MLAVPLLVERASEPFRSNPLPQPRKGEPPRFIPPRLSWGFLFSAFKNTNSPVFSVLFSLRRFLSATVKGCVTHTYGAPPPLTHAGALANKHLHLRTLIHTCE